MFFDNAFYARILSINRCCRIATAPSGFDYVLIAWFDDLIENGYLVIEAHVLALVFVWSNQGACKM